MWNCNGQTWLQLVVPFHLKLSFQMFPPKKDRFGVCEISFVSKYSWRSSSQSCPKTKILRHLNKHLHLWFQRPITNKKLNVHFCFSVSYTFGKIVCRIEWKHSLTIAAIIRPSSLQTLLSLCSFQLYDIERESHTRPIYVILFNFLEALVFWYFGIVMRKGFFAVCLHGNKCNKCNEITIASEYFTKRVQNNWLTGK